MKKAKPKAARTKRAPKPKPAPIAPQKPPSLLPELRRDWFDEVLDDRFAKGGRPDAELDLVLVEKLAALMCTDEEIASISNVSRSTISRRKKNKGFRDILARGRNAGKASLRRRQFASAEAGDRTMLVWLGKQYLGQKDIVTSEHRFPAGGTEEASQSALERLFARVDRAAAAERPAGDVQGP